MSFEAELNKTQEQTSEGRRKSLGERRLESYLRGRLATHSKEIAAIDAEAGEVLRDVMRKAKESLSPEELNEAMGKTLEALSEARLKAGRAVEQKKRGLRERIQRSLSNNRSFYGGLLALVLHYPLLPFEVNYRELVQDLIDVVPRRLHRMLHAKPAEEAAFQEELAARLERGEDVTLREFVRRTDELNGVEPETIERGQTNLDAEIEEIRKKRTKKFDISVAKAVVQAAFGDVPEETYIRTRAVASDILSEGKGNCEARDMKAYLLMEGVMSKEERGTHRLRMQYFSEHQRGVFEFEGSIYALEPGLPKVTDEDRAGTLLLDIKQAMKIYAKPVLDGRVDLKVEPGDYDPKPAVIQATDSYLAASGLKIKLDKPLRRYASSEEDLILGRQERVEQAGVPPEKLIYLTLEHETPIEEVRRRKQEVERIPIQKLRQRYESYGLSFNKDEILSVEAIREINDWHGADRLGVVQYGNLAQFSPEAAREVLRSEALAVEIQMMPTHAPNSDPLPDSRDPFIELSFSTPFLQALQQTDNRNPQNPPYAFKQLVLAQPYVVGPFKIHPEALAELTHVAHGIDVLNFVNFDLTPELASMIGESDFHEVIVSTPWSPLEKRGETENFVDALSILARQKKRVFVFGYSILIRKDRSSRVIRDERIVPWNFHPLECAEFYAYLERLNLDPKRRASYLRELRNGLAAMGYGSEAAQAVLEDARNRVRSWPTNPTSETH